jgi:hypothetical protein
MSVSRLSPIMKRALDGSARFALAFLPSDPFEELGQPVDGAMAQPILVRAQLRTDCNPCRSSLCSQQVTVTTVGRHP